MKALVVIVGFFVSFTSYSEPAKLISLSPHTTELVFALGAGDKLLAVSDYSDFPAEAASLPSVASHHGVDFEKIMALQPDLIIAWQGGNKPQDLNRLRSLGFSLFYSNPASPEDIANEILLLGEQLGKQQTAQKLSTEFTARLTALRKRYQTQAPKSVFYYMWPKPLMSIGGGAWATGLLKICGAKNIFSELAVDYPQVKIEDVIRRRPQVLVASMKTSVTDAKTFWADFEDTLQAQLVVVNPDRLHRFTPRLLDGVEDLCEQLN